MKAAIVTTYRYPTEKAYGVTTAYTCMALKKLGLEVSHFVPGHFSDIDQLGVDFFGLNEPRVVDFFKIFSRVNHHLNQLLIAIKFVSSKNRRENFDLVWTRSPHLIILLKIFSQNTPTFLEIHDSRIFLDRICVRLFANSSTTFFGVISREGFENLYEFSHARNLFKINMASPDDFYRPDRNNLIFQNVGFAGKSKTNGHSNNLEILLAALELVREPEEEFSLDFVGLETSFQRNVYDRFADNPSILTRIKFVEQLPHKDLVGYMKNFDIGVIPYTDSSFNRERFPLKLVEFAAAKIPILLSDTPAHRKLIPEECVTFFPPTPQGFLNHLLEIRKCPEATAKKVFNAHEWSKSFTYEKRVKDILSFISPPSRD